MSMKLDILDGLSDDELRAAIAHAEGLLKQRDDDRKAKALSDARTLLASVGLSLKNLNGKSRVRSGKAAYHVGHHYQHPTNKALTWNGKGQKPGWLRELEGEGGKAVEVAASDGSPAPVRKSA
jgi:DNA-binding protein H-NS